MLEALNNLPIAVLLGALVALVCVVIAGFFACVRLQKAIADKTNQRQERALLDKVALKASDTGRWMVEPDDDLTDSGVSSVLAMMNTLMRQGNLDMAEKWALNAIKNHTGRAEIPLRLAQLYFDRGRKARFIAICQFLDGDRFELSEAQRRSLQEMGTKIAPEHPLFAVDLADCDTAC